MEFDMSRFAGDFLAEGDDYEPDPERFWQDPFAWMQLICNTPEYIQYSTFQSFRILELGDLASTYNGESVIIRIKDMSTATSRLEAIREWQRWRSMTHQNIVPLIGVSILSGQALALIFPAIPNLTEIQRNMRIDELQAMQITANIASALQFIHRRRIIHGDITPMSIVIGPDNNAQLTGFGEDDDDTGFATSCRSARLEYAAPEIINEKLRGPCGFTCRADIWSLGIILCELLNGALVWPTEPGHDFTQFLTSGIRPCLPSNLSAALREIIANCLELEARRRPTAESLSQQLATLIRWRKGNTANAAIVRAHSSMCRQHSESIIMQQQQQQQAHRISGCQSNAQLVYLHSSSHLTGHDLSGPAQLNLEYMVLFQKILRILGFSEHEDWNHIREPERKASEISTVTEVSQSNEATHQTNFCSQNTNTHIEADGEPTSETMTDQAEIESIPSQSETLLTTIVERLIILTMQFFWICTATFVHIIDMLNNRSRLRRPDSA